MNSESAGVGLSKESKLVYVMGGLHVVHGVKDARKEQVTAKTPPSTKPPAAKNQKDSASQKKAEKKYREKEFVSEGNATVIADPSIEANTVVTIDGVGTLNSGNWYVEMVRHTWSREGYGMELELRSNAVGGLKSPAPPTRTVPVTPKPAPQETHTVRSGETLSSIAKKHYGSSSLWKQIWEANKSMLIARDKRNQQTPGQWIYANQKLIIP